MSLNTPSLDKIWEAIDNYGFYTKPFEQQTLEVRRLFPALSENEALGIVQKFRNLFDFISEASLRPEGDIVQVARERHPGFSVDLCKKLLHYCEYMNNR